MAHRSLLFMAWWSTLGLHFQERFIMNTSSSKGTWTDSSAVQGQEILQKWHIHKQVCLPRAGHKAACGCGETELSMPHSSGLDARRESSSNLACLVTRYLHFSQQSKLPAFSQWGKRGTSRVVVTMC